MSNEQEESFARYGDHWWGRVAEDLRQYKAAHRSVWGLVDEELLERYASGEASDADRKVVDDASEHHPAIREWLEACRSLDSPQALYPASEEQKDASTLGDAGAKQDTRKDILVRSIGGSDTRIDPPSPVRSFRPRLIDVVAASFLLCLVSCVAAPVLLHIREKARFETCVNNLKIQGLALANYESAHNAFPPPKIFAHSPYPANDKNGRVLNTTGFTLLLEHIMEPELYNAYNFSQASCNAVNWYGGPNVNVQGTPYANTTVVGRRVWTYLCPSDIYLPVGEDNLSQAFSRQRAARSTYLFCAAAYGDFYNPGSFADGIVPVTMRGAFFTDLPARLRDFTDGFGNTIAIGESVQHKANPTLGPYWGSGTHSAVHGVAQPPVNGYPRYKEYLPRRITGTINLPNGNDWTTGIFSSEHPGDGANMLFVDGSVRFIRKTIAPSVWWGLHTIAGGEVDLDGRY